MAAILMDAAGQVKQIARPVVAESPWIAKRRERNAEACRNSELSTPTESSLELKLELDENDSDEITSVFASPLGLTIPPLRIEEIASP